jgi:uncharacterized protein YodC (DUF2158 family)
MDTIFAVGDTVKLKSGGAMMCIRAFRRCDEDYAECVWHEGKRPRLQVYPLAALVQCPIESS